MRHSRNEFYEVQLQPGGAPRSSAHYRADVAHAIVNTGNGEAVFFLVNIYR